MPEFKGKTKPITRRSTGLHSLDRALLGGMPLMSNYEIYGFTHVGKSSLAYYLSGRVREDGKIMLADFEHFDPEYVLSSTGMAGFDGEIHETNTDYGEAAVEDLKNALLDEEYQAGILDSIGALMPKKEIEGEVTDANMGLKPRLVAKMMRLTLYCFKRNPESAFFMINHLHPIMSLQNAHTTSGGVAVHNNTHVRLRLSRLKDDEYYHIVQGRVDKLRYGGRGDKRGFHFVILPEVGVHPGLSMIEDCKWYGLLDSGNRIKMDGENYGFFKSIARKELDGDIEPDFYEPFKEKLNDEMGADFNPPDFETSDD